MFFVPSDIAGDVKAEVEKLKDDVDGMTLRDYFAAKAMQGAIAGMAARAETLIYRECSGLAYEMADAMLAERCKND